MAKQLNSRLLGALPQTTGGFAARMKLGSPQTPAGALPHIPLGLRPNTVHEGVWGGAPSGVWGGAPSFALAAKPPGVWGRKRK